MTRAIAKRGQVFGLLGGSFDPAHEGHVHITTTALKRFRLDRVLWMLSPGNPLKDRGPAPMADRMQAAKTLIDDPRIGVTDIEAQLGTTYTADTLAALMARHKGVRFVWLMGADNLAQFHLWQDWRWIMENVPIGVVARPGDRIAARMSKAATVYANARIPGRAAHTLGRQTAPAWSFINLPLSSQSSSAIRARGEWR